MVFLYNVLVLVLVLASNSVIKCTPVEFEEDLSDEYENFNSIFANATRNGIIENFKILTEILAEWLNNTLSSQSKTETCGNREANRPTQDESCYYPYRSNKPLYCFYSLLWGNRTNNDVQVFQKQYQTNSITEALEIDFQDPDGRLINFIMLDDPRDSKTKRIFEDYVRIRQGGVNCSSVKMTIESDNPEWREYNIVIFAQ